MHYYIEVHPNILKLNALLKYLCSQFSLHQFFADFFKFSGCFLKP